MKKRVLIVLAVLVVAAVGLYLYRVSGTNDDGVIRVSGNIEIEEVNIGFKTPGRLVERTVTEGDPVSKGQTIARLDDRTLIEQRAAAVAALEMAKAQLAQAETGVTYIREAQSADLAGRHAELGAMQARLRELKAGSRPEEIGEASAAVAAATAEFERARSDWERAQQLFKDDDISRAQYDQARARFEASQAALSQTRERLQLAKTGPRAEVIEAQASQVERARAAVRGVEASALEIKRRMQEIGARRADVERARAQVDLLDTQIRDMVAISPVDGTVLVKAAEPGEVLAAGSTVVTVGDLERPWVRAYITATDLGRVRIGMPVNVTTDSHSGKVYRGRLTWVSSEAEFTPRQIQTQEERVKLVYRVKIAVENPNGELKSNMPADAEIVVEGGTR